MRDDFSADVKRTLAARAGHRCSICGKATSGPSTYPGVALSDGVAAHITAASPRGPRFDPSLSAEERRSAENGIWVCTQHGREIDTDSLGYSAETLRGRMRFREETAAKELGQAASTEDQSARVIELPYADNTYKLFEIIQTQSHTYPTISVIREQLRRARQPSHLLDLASQVTVETWQSHPESAGILSTLLGNNSDLWQPTPPIMDKMEQLCETEISADDWTRVALTEPLGFALAAKGRPEIHKKALERMICNTRWRDAEAAHSRRYYGTLGAEVSSIIRHWEERFRYDLLRAHDAPRIIDLLLAGNKELKRPSTRHLLLDLLAKQSKILAEGGEIKLARDVAELVDALQLAQNE